MKTKKHWTQTREGKKRVKLTLAKANKARLAKHRGNVRYTPCGECRVCVAYRLAGIPTQWVMCLKTNPNGAAS